MIKKLEILTFAIFLVHSIASIIVVAELNNANFSAFTLIMLILACACTLLYETLMMYHVGVKLKAMGAKGYKVVTGVSIFLVSILKIISFIIVFYIAGQNFGQSDFGQAYSSDLAMIGQYLNTSGNFIYIVYNVYAIFGYGNFPQACNY